MKEKIINKNSINEIFYKTNPRVGISLIVLVITIIVVIILAAAVIISLQNNNPMFQASEARIKSDVANMQAIFTNAVGKIMAEKQDTLVITAGKLNSVTSGGKSAVGNAVYTLADGTSGEIIFDELLNAEEKYYTGSKLPLYKQKTAWYVDEQGLIAVEVGNKKYGEGRIVKSIKISTEVTPVEEYIITKVKVKIEIDYENEVESIKFGGEDVAIPQKQDGKYVVEKEVTENGTYEIEVNGQNEEKNTATVEVNQIDTLSQQINIVTSVDLSEKYSAKVRIEVSSVDEIKSITLGGVSVSGIQVIDGKYVGEVTVAENGTYEVEAKGKSGSKNKVSLTITKIQIDNRIEIAQSASPVMQRWETYPTTDFHASAYRKKITKAKFVITDKVPDTKIESWDVSESKDKSVMSWIENDGNGGYIVTIASKSKIIANQNSSNLFYNFPELKTIENLELLDTSNVKFMENMFCNCTKLESIDVSSFNTNNVTNMSSMFYGCRSLTSLDLSSLNINGVSMQKMFGYCTSLITLKLPTINYYYGSCLDVGGMFENCSKISTTLTFNFVHISKVSYNDLKIFNNAATEPNAKIIVKYNNNVYENYIDELIATKSENSNVVKELYSN